MYGVSSVPMSFLVDPNGIIVAKNLRGIELHRQLDKYVTSLVSEVRSLTEFARLGSSGPCRIYRHLVASSRREMRLACHLSLCRPNHKNAMNTEEVNDPEVKDVHEDALIQSTQEEQANAPEAAEGAAEVAADEAGRRHGLAGQVPPPTPSLTISEAHA